jgi:hypothetical protein
MSNTSQPVTSTILNSNLERKTTNPPNPSDLTSVVAITSSSPASSHSNNKNLNNNEDTLSRHTVVNSHSAETKHVERTTRKECYRLGRRKLLFEKRRKASDYALFFAMIGLLFMVLEQELTMAKIYDKVKQTK